MRKLPLKSLRVLRDICEGRGTHHDCHGQSQHGGRHTILFALMQRGLLDWDCKPTAAGRKLATHTGGSSMKPTDKQLSALADKLIDTSSNIYLVAKTMFPKVKITDADWERLEKIGKIFKCEECNLWRGMSLKVPHLISTCVECDEEDDGEDA